MRKPIIAANWKMHKTVAEAVDFCVKLRETVLTVSGVEVLVCPPFTALSPVSAVIKDSEIKLGAQNMHWEEQGAFTGEVSPLMLKEAGCDYVILGHSERRQFFGETDEVINKKARAAFAHDLLPIICVGERLEQREAGETEAVVTAQVNNSLSGLTAAQVDKLVIAYEPVWAIGTGKTASDEDAQSVIKLIRSLVAEQFNPASAEKLRIQYGGSVKPGNTAGLMAQADIDGALVGGASLDLESFWGIVKAVK
ncbi:triosephosphate isomerase [Desulfofarcimen acetoxidans DSM 771]|uniref:Triosephosphate isomerase n=1 Tax=Desulfofarcimen acetoxidans (strain ATCC 49208 / DSM 771 / KCTC 5769 / VKM B-1644 / 5575) TaxID=485916 RepID=C8VXZ9_DESAS|nr:triose-phosphate isomerase [Desulfofarcimen acetoxidans]ACV64628.1 triosephosphate isomerase [Desulfofarcimen acetoxidans DSM 771]